MEKDLEQRVKYLEGVIHQLVLSDRYAFQKNIQLLDGTDITIATGTGTKIGTSANAKIGFYGHAPVIRQSPSSTASSLLAALQAYGLAN